MENEASQEDVGVARKLAEHKAPHKDTRSMRRALKRLSLRQRNFTRTYAQTLAKRFMEWAGSGVVLAFEKIRSRPGKKGLRVLNRQFHQFPHGLLFRCIPNKAEMLGLPVTTVSPFNTSKTCSLCGQLGDRDRHRFRCPHCSLTMHADINAAINIRNHARELVLSGPCGLGSRLLSASPEAQTAPAVPGKPSAKADGG